MEEAGNVTRLLTLVFGWHFSKCAPTLRPSLTGKQPEAEIEELLARRSAAYAELSELKVDSETSSPLELARGIARDLTSLGLGSPSPSEDP